MKCLETFRSVYRRVHVLRDGAGSLDLAKAGFEVTCMLEMTL